VTRVLDGILSAASLPHIRFHDLRHSTALMLPAQGLDLVEISELLGHSEIRVTADLNAPAKGDCREGGPSHGCAVD
jgi:integrase